MSNLALQNQVEYTLTLVSGPDKGEVFKLMSTTIRIGRSSENDIILAKDTKCSRHHAEIIISSNGILIRSLNPKNLVSVDGKQGETIMISHNSKIKIGSTKILFQISMLVNDEVNSPALFPQDSQQEKGIGPSRPQKMPEQKQNLGPKKGKTNNFKMFLFAVLFIVILFIITEKSKKAEKANTIRTEKDVENEIETINKLREAERKLQARKGTSSPQFKEAQSHYIKGFRDYEKGKFERAISSFQACTSIFPNHDLCKTYKKLSMKRYQELIQYHMIRGKKFVDNGQYSACISSYKNVMFMVKDRASKVYQEANAQRKLCESRIKGRF